MATPILSGVVSVALEYILKPISRAIGIARAHVLNARFSYLGNWRYAVLTGRSYSPSSV